MITLLTPTLIEFLLTKEYRFCLSKTSSVNMELYDTAILLKPVKYRPHLRNLPKDFDTYFALHREPLQMAEGIDHTLIVVELTNEDLTGYLGRFLAHSNREVA